LHIFVTRLSRQPLKRRVPSQLCANFFLNVSKNSNKYEIPTIKKEFCIKDQIAHLLGREGAEGDEHVVSVQQASRMNNRGILHMMKASHFSQVVLGVFKLRVNSFKKVMDGNDSIVQVSRLKL
jgi:hypothetical protein